MSKFYRDYLWKGGIPYGIQPHDDMRGYKIVMDPYRKRISIEFYEQDPIPKLIYDSALLDFRHLKQPEQLAWQKSVVHESAQEVVCLIRDQNDRLLFIETTLFEKDLCRECRVTSLQGIPLSVHKMFYKLLNEPFDGVILYDTNAHPVMLKRYLFDPKGLQFTELQEELWEDLQKVSLLSPTLHG